MSNEQVSQQAEAIARALVKRIDFQRRLALVILLLCSVVACIGVVYYNTERAQNYAVEIDTVAKLIVQADETFGKLASKQTLQPASLEAAATEAEESLLDCQSTLESMWSPKPFTAMHNSLTSTAGAHAAFYSKLAELVKDPPFDANDQIKSAWNEARDGYKGCSANIEGLALPSLPRLSTATAKRAAGFVIAAGQKRDAIASLRSYCQNIDDWKQRYDKERNRFADALKIVRVEATTSYYTSTSETQRGLEERRSLKGELEQMSAPAAFAGFHRSMIAAVRDGYMAAYYYNEYAERISSSFMGPNDPFAQRYRTEADVYNKRVNRSLANSWNSFMGLRKKYLTDPYKTPVASAKVEGNWE